MILFMARKRSNGEGAMRKRPNGLWECSIMVGYQKDGKRKYKSFYGRTQREVKEKVQKYRISTGNDGMRQPDVLFSDWSEQWYENYQDMVEGSTYGNYQFTLSRLNAYFGSMYLRDIRTMDIEQYLKAEAAAGLSRSYLSKLRGMLHQIMRKAAANRLIDQNPVEYADKIRTEEVEQKKDSFTSEEIKIIMKDLPIDAVGCSIRVLIGTGMRMQELLALEPRHITENGAYIQIEQAVKLVCGVPELGCPKSKSSYRLIPVPEKIRPFLLMLRRSSGRYVLSGAKDGFMNPSTYRRKFKNALEQLAGVRVLTPHCCRHTYISQMQAAGVSMETIQALAGHAEMEMTQHYLHVQDGVKWDAVERLDGVM